MINEKILKWGTSRSVIRELFEYGNALKREKGEDAVCDFTLGNPSVPSPKEVNAAIKEIIDRPNAHAYTSATGALNVREKIVKALNKRFNADYSPDGIIMTTGAAASLAIVFKALVSSADENIIALKPYFPEYKVFIESAGGVCREADFDEDLSFSLEDIERKIDKDTLAIVVNSPNNPTGAIYSEEKLRSLAALLEKKQAEYAHPIYIISDEPYREIVFDGAALPFIPKIYKNTITCYSYSKSLSVPGERIGYIIMRPTVDLYETLCYAFLGAARANGYVCAPSLFQYVIAEIGEVFSDTEVYKTNRDIFYEELKKMGYSCVKPQGAFYLFIKSPLGTSIEFSERAKKYGLLIVPADSFGAPGYLRIATCVKTETVKRSLPIFKKLIEEK